VSWAQTAPTGSAREKSPWESVTVSVDSAALALVAIRVNLAPDTPTPESGVIKRPSTAIRSESLHPTTMRQVSWHALNSPAVSADAE